MQKKTYLKRILQIFLIIFILGTTIYSMCSIDLKLLLKEIEELPLFIKALTMIFLIMAQVVFAFLPVEPFELASGFLFGNLIGTILCLIDSCLGTFFIYYLVRFFKYRIIDLFFSRQKIQEVEQVLSKNKNQFWFFLIFLIPGSPKDVLTYVASLGKMNLIKWLTMTTLGRIPSILTSTYLSSSLKDGDMISAFIVLLLTIIMVIVGAFYYRNSTKKSEI